MNTTLRWCRRAVGTAFGGRRPFALCYHGVGTVAPGTDPHGLFVAPPLFERHLDAIARAGYAVVGAEELWRRIGTRDGHGVGAVTFDDAIAGLLEEAVPRLQARGMGASLYVTTGLLGKPHPHIDGTRIMTAEEVRAFADAGFEVGAHTVDHPDLRSLSDADLRDQLRRSRAELEDLLGRAVVSMAYPFGVADARVERAAAEAGYELACACAGPGPWRALSFPREAVFPRTTQVRLRVKIAGLYGPVSRASELWGRLSPRRAGA